MRTVRRKELNEADRAARASTGIRAARRETVFTAPAFALPGPEAPYRDLIKSQAWRPSGLMAAMGNREKDEPCAGFPSVP